MLLIDNVNILRTHFPFVRNLIKQMEESEQQLPVEVVQTRTGQYTVKCDKGGRGTYLHSQYDPVHEAERFIDQFQDVEHYNHVFFYGVGMGYHIEAFMKRYPRFSFTMYEPDPAILYCYLSHRHLNALPLKKLKQLYVQDTSENRLPILHDFLNIVTDMKVLFISLPSYERIFKEETKAFISLFREVVYEKKTGIQANMSYQKLWTINSMMNLKKVVGTDNIIRQKRKFFQGKTAILAAAGPSLQEEIENLRYIKENRLAYIFSVGSAINSLVENEVYPDAACTYDPNVHNFQVFRKVVERNIDIIPLVFGSSVGFETLNQYTGPLLHMIINQDSVSPFYLFDEHINDSQIVNDAPTIAIVTMDLLAKLGISEIIFVGQNFAFKNNQYYSSGISYNNRPTEIQEHEMDTLVTTEAVDGGEVYTLPSFVQARKQMENYLAALSDIQFINATQGGSKIKGTTFMKLTDVIETKLKDKIVEDSWYKFEGNGYNPEFINGQIKLMDKEHEEMPFIIDSIVKILKEMNELVEKRQEQQLNRMFPMFDKVVQRLLDNKYYHVFIRPMSRIQWEMVDKSIVEIRQTLNPVKKANMVIRKFGGYIHECHQDLRNVEAIYQSLRSSVLELVKNEGNVKENA